MKCIQWFAGLMVILMQSIGMAVSLPQVDRWPTLLPALENGKTPAWVKPGLRLSYHTAFANIRGNRKSLEVDAHGNWVDAQGNRYSLQDAQSGGSGEAVTQVNIASVTRQGVALDIRNYSLTQQGLPPFLSSLSGTIAGGASGGDYWLDPQILKTLRECHEGVLKIVRMPFVFDGKSVPAVRFQYQSAQATYAIMFDEATGVMLFGSIAMASPNQQWRDEWGATHEGGGGILLSQTRFQGMRQVNGLPVNGGTLPDWLTQTRQLNYSGGQAVIMPGMPVFPLPVTLTYQVQHQGQGWLLGEQTIRLPGGNGMPSSESSFSRITAARIFTGFWMPPAYLKKLIPGKTLDHDPYTKMSVVVGQKTMLLQRHCISIIEGNTAQQFESFYDLESGRLLYLTEINAATTMRTELSAQ